MASQWGESVSIDYADLQANGMAVNCLGKWAVLAGRRVMALVDLDDPGEKIYRLTRQSKWDIGCIQWNPHASHAQLFATACTQRLDLYSWDEGTSKQVCSMKAHTRNISDIDWSPFDVNVIASCSVDAYTLLWDVRDPKRPTASFQSVCGASQVKWNKVTNNLFATAHEGEVRIWDPRKPNGPLVYMTAHLSKIHGLDWNPSKELIFATASQDCTVKFWDYLNWRQDKGMLKSGSPVWRARYTPFGDGLVTVVTSTLRRGEYSLFLWNNASLEQPVHQFVGHSDVVLEFQWRKKDDASKDYQLVTWSRDQNLKIWKVDQQLQRLCGHEIADSSENELSGAECSSTVKENGHDHPALSEVDDAKTGNQLDQTSHQQPMTLSQEFSLVNQQIPNVNIEKMDTQQRLCSVSASTGKHVIYLTIYFPTNYPHVAAPNFEIMSQTGLGSGVIKKLYKVLNETSQTCVKRNLNCLEPCIRQFATQFENMTLEERKTPDSDSFTPSTSKLTQSFMQQLPYAQFQDYSIPFPRTCGARFNSAGLLICFGRSKEASNRSEKTPKALSDLAVYSSTNRVRSSQSSSGFSTMFSRSPPTPKAEPVSISSYYIYKRPRTKSRTFRDKPEQKWNSFDKAMKKEKKIFKLEPVKIFDIHCLLNVHRELAENYRLDVDNINGMCEHNMKQAASVGRKDLVRLWSLIPITCSSVLKPSNNPDDGTPWAQQSFGRKMLESLIEYYKKIYDVQTLAMICCIFWDKKVLLSITQSQNMKKSPSKASLDYIPPNYNPYHTVSSMSGLLRSLTKALKEQKQQEPVDDTATIPEASSLSPPVNVTSPTNTSFFYRAMVKIRRTNSLSDFSFEDYKFEETDPKQKAEELERKQHENNCRLLDPSKYGQYDNFLKVYADILYRWGLANQCTEILKHVTLPPEPHAGIEFGVQCYNCRADVRGAKCGTCKMQAFNCVICHIGVRGASNFCLNCGHGGHTLHMKEWFKKEESCPTGCGCQCMKWNPF
ncbi:GATOR complex protein wdr59 [Mactra antiquata]